MRTPSSAELLDAWEAGGPMGPSARAVSLLLSSCPEDDPDLLASLDVGERDRRLLDLRERLFGPRLSGLVTCPACGERLEVQATMTELRRPQPSSQPSPGEGERYSDGEWDVRFRLPNSRDVASIEGVPAELPARRALLQRCLLEVKRDGVEVPAAEVPDALGVLIGQQMAAADPQAVLEVPVECPECNNSWSAGFDVTRFMWAELDAWARRLLRQVHEIAIAYSWSEADILRLSPARRARYLELIVA